MADKENQSSNINMDGMGPKMKKMTHEQHILEKSGMYIGSVKVQEKESYWVCSEDEAGPRMQWRECKASVAPGLYKLFDEILVNAADNKQRDTPKQVMTKLEVTIGADFVTVKNNGCGISVKKHDEYKDKDDNPIYIPELIFGTLLTSSNYDENVKQTVGGTNGLGAKLVNIYSKKFIVEIDDAAAKQSYRQEWRNNMKDKEKVKLTSYSGSTNSTSITFFPDFARFGMGATNCFNQDMKDLFTKRVYDIAGTTKSLKVKLNDHPIGISSFKEYMALYLGNDRPAVLEQVHPRFQVGCSINDSGSFAQISFVNSIATTDGGKHVDYMEELVAEALLEQIKKKNKTLKDTKPAEIKKHLFMFVNALVCNPTFDSQTKARCTSTKTDLQTNVDGKKDKIVLPESFVKSLTKSGLVAVLTERLTERGIKSMSKTDGKKLVKRLTGIPKLEDANKAGTKDGHACTLILTEGDSAKALAVSGLSVVGRDLYGVFPLKGKLLNVREASHKQIMENSEVTAIKQILGLKANVKYTDAKDLRYGHVMIMADQDHDGSHIKGLIINLFAHFWPSLLQLPGFLQEFITPIVKVSKGVSASGVMSKGAKEQCFYTIPEYEAWKEAVGEAKGWTIKYYKGLGTSTAVEAKNYFSDLSKHNLTFSYTGQLDDQAIDLAFSRAKADARKDWLGGFAPGTFLSQEAGKLIPYSEFVHKELILFSVASNLRAIPNVIDGFKPGQRKILYSALKRNLKKEIKVAQLAGYVSENSAYHHGEASLCATIIGMAQNFVGSNNINLLLPNGQFGTRLQGGKDAASPRYIFTSLNPVTRAIFPALDDGLLNYLNDDGQMVEPEFYVPILPMVLVNGSSGIGTGWSSNVANYDPRAIVNNLRKMISIHDSFNGDAAAMEIPFISQLPELHPQYKGFVGAVKHKGANSYIVKGVIEKLPDGNIHIKELPLQKWTSDYKTYLESMLTAGEIKEFREYHTDSKVSFVVELTPEQLHAYETGGMTLYKKFKLNSSLTSSNMVLFTKDGKLKRYNSANDILIDFFHVRMEYYQKRKAMMLDAARAEERKLTDKVRFIREVNAGTIVMKDGKPKLLAALVRGKYMRIPKKAKVKANGEEDQGEEEEVEEKVSGDEPRLSDYDYLVSIPLVSLTPEDADALEKVARAKVAEVKALLATTPSQMWLTDLANFDVALNEYEQNEAAQEAQAAQRSLEKRLGSIKSDAQRKKLRAELENPVEPGILVQDFSDDFDEDKPVKEKKPKKEKKDATTNDLEMDDDEEKSSVTVPKEKKKSTVTKKLAPKEDGVKKPAAKKKSKKAASDDDEDDEDMDLDEESDEDSFLPVAPRETVRRAAATKKITYVESDEEEADEEVKSMDEDEDEEDFDMDEEDDDYELSAKKPKKAAAEPKVVPVAVKKIAPVAAVPAVAPKKKAAPKKKKRASDEEEEEDEADESVSEFDDEDDEDFDAPKKKKKAAAAAPKPKAVKPAAPKKTAAPKAEKAEKAAPIPSTIAKSVAKAATATSSSITTPPTEMSLADRLAARLAATTLSSNQTSPVAAPSTPPKPKAKAAKREKEAPAILSSPISPDPKRRKLFNAAQTKQALDEAAATPVMKTKAKKAETAAPAKKKESASSTSTSAAAAATSSRPQRATKSIKSYVEKSDDDEDEEEEEEEEDMSVEEISDDDYED